MKRHFTLMLASVIVITAVVAIVWHGKFAVTSQERHDQFSGVSYGYLVQQSFFWNSASLTIWVKRGRHHQMDATFYMPHVSIQEIKEQRWLSDGAAFYLDLTIQNHDSIKSTGSLRMIFDFHKGQMFTSSQFTLWRFWNERNSYEEWIGEAAFNEVLRRYGGAAGK